MICWKRCDADEVRNGRHKISLSLSWVMTILAIKFCWSVLFGRTSMPIQRSTVGCFIYLLLYWWMQKSCDANSMKKNRNFSHRQRHHNLMKQTHFSHSFQWTHLFTNKWPLIQCYFCHREAVNKKSMYTSGDIEILSTYCMCVLELIFFQEKNMFNHQHGTVPTVSIFEWRERSDLLHVDIVKCVYVLAVCMWLKIFSKKYTPV